MIDKFTALVPILKPKSTEMYAYFKTLFRKDVYFTSEPQRLAVESSQVIIIKYGENIKTDGNILFKRYSTEIVALLKEGNFLEVYNKRFEVVNNKLCMIL